MNTITERELIKRSEEAQVVTSDSTRLKHWSRDVKFRDEYECKLCYRKDVTIHERETVALHSGLRLINTRTSVSSKYMCAHHIIPYAHDEALRHDIRNGVTLCIDCHKLIHRRIREWNKSDIDKNTRKALRAAKREENKRLDKAYEEKRRSRIVQRQQITKGTLRRG